MSSNSKDLKKLIEMIFEEQFKEIKSDIKEIKSDNSSNRELIERINFIISDLSSKTDLGLTTLNINTKSTTKKINTSTESEKKKSPNVMVFFKNKFKTDPESMNFLYSQDELDELYKENATEIRKKSKNKETELNCKARLAYKHFVKDHSDSVNRTKILKNIQKTEENSEIVIAPEILENNFSDDEPVKKYAESEDSDSD